MQACSLTVFDSRTITMFEVGQRWLTAFWELIEITKVVEAWGQEYIYYAVVLEDGSLQTLFDDLGREIEFSRNSQLTANWMLVEV